MWGGDAYALLAWARFGSPENTPGLSAGGECSAYLTGFVGLSQICVQAPRDFIGIPLSILVVRKVALNHEAGVMVEVIAA